MLSSHLELCQALKRLKACMKEETTRSSSSVQWVQGGLKELRKPLRTETTLASLTVAQATQSLPRFVPEPQRPPAKTSLWQNFNLPDKAAKDRLGTGLGAAGSREQASSLRLRESYDLREFKASVSTVVQP